MVSHQRFHIAGKLEVSFSIFWMSRLTLCIACIQSLFYCYQSVPFSCKPCACRCQWCALSFGAQSQAVTGVPCLSSGTVLLSDMLPASSWKPPAPPPPPPAPPPKNKLKIMTTVSELHPSFWVSVSLWTRGITDNQGNCSEHFLMRIHCKSVLNGKLAEPVSGFTMDRWHPTRCCCPALRGCAPLPWIAWRSSRSVSSLTI